MSVIVHRTRIVTLPRSGHHWLVRMLQSVLGDAMKYSEYHQTGVTLESDPTVNIQKTHDFDLDVNPRACFTHVIQIRDVESAMKSWWRMNPAHGLSYESFREQHMPYAQAFLRKWIGAEEPHLVIAYEDLSRNPVDSVRKVLLRITDLNWDDAMRLAERAALIEPSKESAYRATDYTI